MNERHILIVDDDCDLLDLLKRAIEVICPRCRVWVANSGPEALKIISTRADATPFNLILTDFQMPRMNGINLAHAVRELHPGANIVLMSASGEELYMSEMARQHNLDAYLKKPFTLSRLQHLLNSATCPVKEQCHAYH